MLESAKLRSSAKHVLGNWKKRVSLYLGFYPSLSQCFSLKTGFTRRPPSPGQEKCLLLYRSCPKLENLDVPCNEMLWWRSTSSLFPLVGNCPLVLAEKGPLLPALELLLKESAGPSMYVRDAFKTPCSHTYYFISSKFVSCKKLVRSCVVFLDIPFSFYKSVV